MRAGRLRQRLSSFIGGAVFAAATMSAVPIITVGGSAVHAVTLGPVTTPFEVDGDPAVGSGVGAQDWNNAATQPNLQDLRINNVTPNNPEPCGGGSDINRMTPGTKIGDISANTAGIPVSAGNVNTKSDLCKVYTTWELVFVPTASTTDDETAGQYHFVLYGAWSRFNVKGEIDVLWILGGSNDASNTDDLIINYDFVDSSGATSFTIERWNPTTSTWETSALPANTFSAVTSRAAAVDPQLPGQELTFGEFAIDLTAAGVLPENGPCATLTTRGVVSRTGNSPSATLEDFVGIVPQVVLTQCASLQVTKVAQPAPIDETQFGFTVNELDGQPIQSPNTTSINDTLTVPGSGTKTYTNMLISPDYNVVETNLPAGWTEQSVICTSYDPITSQNVTRTLFSGGTLGPDPDFPLAPNHQATCTITNAGPPFVNLYKKTLGAPGGPFTLDLRAPEGGGGATDSTTEAGINTFFVGYQGLPGPYTFDETSIPPGFTLKDLSCTITHSDGSKTVTPPGTTPVDMDLVGGDLADCVATNVANGSVTVTKTVDPATTTNWSFEVAIDPVPDGETSPKTVTAANPSVSWANLSPGTTYQLSETAVDGFISGQMSCTGAVGVEPSTPLGAGFSTDPLGGEIVECAVTNVQRPKVEVTKTVLPSSDTGWSFDVTISPQVGTQPATRTATSGAPTVTWDNLDPGVEYTITEAAQAGYTNGTVNCGSGTGTFTPTAGQTVRCGVTNKRDASLTVTKTVEPVTRTGWSFNFTIDPPIAGQPTTREATSAQPAVTWTGLKADTQYTVTETPNGDYTASLLACFGITGVGTVTPPTGTDPAAAFIAGPGDDVQCTITNTVRPAEVSVTKTVVPASDTGWSFGFTISPVPTGETAVKTATSAARTVTWRNLNAGTQYTIVENAKAGYTNGRVSCNEGGNSFTPRGGDVISCGVTNTKFATATVTKTVAPSAATGWDFAFTISPVPQGETATKHARPGAASVTWSGLRDGTQYTIREAVQANWTEGELGCTGATGQGEFDPPGGTGPAATFIAGAGNNIRCTVTNTAETGSITIRKSVTGTVASDDWSFNFSVTPAGGNTNPKAVTKAKPSAVWTNLASFTTYTIKESPSANRRYATGTINCGAVSGDAATGITVRLGLNQDLVCTATNRRLPADVQLVKSTTSTVVLPGDTIVWVLDLKNNGPSPADQIVVTDALPSVLTLVSASGPGYNCAGSTLGNPGVVRCTKALMNVGETGKITVTTTLTGLVIPGDSIANVAKVTTTTGETNAVNNSDDARVQVDMPVTGSNPKPTLFVGALLCGAGLILTRTGRRRRRATVIVTVGL